MSAMPAPSLFQLLAELDGAAAEISNTWRPDDSRYRAELYRQIMMNLSYAYFPYFHADAEHPDWSPLWNPVYTLQPNPDDIYLYSPLRGDLTYRVSGNRGTVRKLIFNTQYGLSGLIENMTDCSDANDLDETDLNIGPGGEFEVVFSAERPAGYTGNWAKMSRKATVMMVRYRSWDWLNERDPQLSIECLDAVPLKPRLQLEDIYQRIRDMASFARRMSKSFFAWQNAIKDRVGINKFELVKYAGMSKQVYWPAIFALDDGEALIIETDMPAVRPYWNIQLNDPLFNAIEYVYRLSSLNGATARISSDGKLRAVIALEDPKVPNWLDPAGFKEGDIYGRWYGCDSVPEPVIKRVPYAKLRDYLPEDTPVVTAEERAAEIRVRVRGAQRRRRW